jgi:arylsulfatase
MADRMYLAVPAQRYVAKFLGTFKEYPPRMKPGSFTIDKVMEKLQTPATH